MDGIEIIKHLKNDAWGKNARILIITASDATEESLMDSNIKDEDIIHKSRSSISDIVLRVEKELA